MKSRHVLHENEMLCNFPRREVLVLWVVTSTSSVRVQTLDVFHSGCLNTALFGSILEKKEVWKLLWARQR